MPPVAIFITGLVLLGLFVAYFGADSDARKRFYGTVLTILLAAFCIYTVIPPKETIKLGIDLKGGSSFQVAIEPKEGETLVSESAREQARAILRKRLDPDGKNDLLITPQGENSLEIQMPGVKEEDRADIRTKIEQVANLELRIVHPQSDSLIPQIEAGTHLEPGFVIREYRESDDPEARSGKELVSSVPDMTGKSISAAHAALYPKGWVILLDFDSEGGKAFGDLTTANSGKQMAILMDGEILSAPNINEPITGGSCEISGSFTRESATALASALENPLENALTIEGERSVDATMGADTIKQGIFAGIGGLLATLVFMVAYYRLAGFIAVLGLFLNILMIFAAMALFGFTLTMPGIAGVLLTIGIAIDANVLIYERLREEMQAGKSVAAAIETAYEKAFSAIFDANATTLITAVILFTVASGLVKGFALTLTLGVLSSMFAALLVTRVCFNWGLKAGMIRKLSMWNLISSKNFDFLGKRKVCGIASLVAVVLALGFLGLKGDKALGVDFVGGHLTTLQTIPGKDVDTEKITAAVTGLPYTVTEGGKEESKTIREVAVQSQASATTEGETYITIRTDFGSGEAVEKKLHEVFGTESFKLSVDKVGPSVGKALLYKSAMALVLGMLGILIYLTVRFEFSFALGAIVALTHDLIITGGIVALCGYEISLVLVGAFLTIAGYSINDTIVVFDRIRESLRNKRGNIRDIMNEAINATLSRTMLTSLVTLITLVTLFWFGGTSLKAFAFTIIAGILVGTYSSIFVASPIVYWWARSRKKSLRREVLESDQASVNATV